MEILISLNALESALYAAKSTHPHEFVGLFREKNGILCELLVAPLTISDESSATFPVYAIPTDPTIVATYHSHPSMGTPRPSRADLNLFSRHYRIHFISSYPHTTQTTRAFSNLGEPLSFTIVD
ncbi:MAG: Mov34/MPN/PAD-1 family protein [Candidatus Micrarchaeota archaeon]